MFKCSIPALLAACRSGTALAEAEPLLSDLLGGHLWPVRPLLILWLEDVRIWVSISKSEFKKTNLGQFGCGSSPSYSLIGVYCNTHIHICIYIYIFHLGVWLRVHIGGRIAQVHTPHCQSSRPGHVNVKAPAWQPDQFVGGGMPVGLAALYPREWD